MRKKHGEDNLIRILKRNSIIEDKSKSLIPLLGKVMLRIVKRSQNEETINRKQTRTSDYGFSTLLASHGR